MPDSTENSKQMVGDQPTTEDILGFTPYVVAMAEFLTNKDTKPPLTISIEGEWGSGKSSFMKQLETEVKSKSKELHEENLRKIKQKDKFFRFLKPKFWKLIFKQEAKTIWFNAWRHEKSESLWAAFTLSFLDQLSNNRNFSDFVINIFLWFEALHLSFEIHRKTVKSNSSLNKICFDYLYYCNYYSCVLESLVGENSSII
ncbi:MAG: hypothetical protein F6K22_29925 [Okeania sp. SIO2F4]|uniref:P-loop NTPase fold protein n=1 Tax=Okeania sp. SIO2F4 TaxID=2607790 RepID=UPI001428EED0|nr:P-loop NTPase fold protein [Okeania sp. SIO2F4]NES06669.1 hypothetical protein [Okeania sp. SIO2F4]